MFGVGTANTCLAYDQFDYVELIGKDENSWGLAHTGKIYHEGVGTPFCDAFFDENTVVGMLLDLNEHTFHYFLNGTYLGVAFRLAKSFLFIDIVILI